jgi:hypothetical protein
MVRRPLAKMITRANETKVREAYPLAIDLDRTMDHKLPGLSDTACEHCSKHGRVQPPFQRCICHLHVRNRKLFRRSSSLINAGTTTSRLDLSIIGREVFWIHGNDRPQPSIEHPLPYLLPHLVPVIISRQGLRLPLGLEEVLISEWVGGHSAEIVKIVFAPRLSQFLIGGRNVSG